MHAQPTRVGAGDEKSNDKAGLLLYSYPPSVERAALPHDGDRAQFWLDARPGRGAHRVIRLNWAAQGCPRHARGPL